MANLPGIAQRLNDVEINNNKPVSSQTERRVGSSVNYLLDYLNIPDAAISGGPTTGLTVFSPRVDISYSYTFGAGDYNVSKTLFTFEGAGDRQLRFFKPDNGFALAEVKDVGKAIEQNGGGPATVTLPFYGNIGINDETISNVGPCHVYPILHLLRQLSALNTIVGGFTSGQAVWIVYVNGIEMGRCINTNLRPVCDIQYTREINRAPAGTNTVTVLKLSASAATTPVSSSFSYITT